MPPPVLNKPAPKKRLKYAPGTGTPRQRALMLGGVVVCLVAVLLIPSAPPEDEVDVSGKPPAGVAQPVKVEKVATKKSNDLSPERPFDDTAAPNLILPPVSEITLFPATTPEEVNKRVDALSQYFLTASQKDKDAALAALMEMKESILPKLPKLIKECNTPAMVYYITLAEQINAENCTDVLIEKVSARPLPGSWREMLQALASFKNPKARQFIMAGLKGPQSADYWTSIRFNMDSERRELALAVASNGKVGAAAAADALAYFGKEQANAIDLQDRIRQALDKAPPEGKLALVQALSGMHPDTVANSLTQFTTDLDPKIRVAAITGMGQNAQHVSTLIQILKTDEDLDVQLACIQGLLNNPTDESLGELVQQMEKPEFLLPIHRGLVRFNKGVDLGKFPFPWQFWYRKAEYKDPADRPKVVEKAQDPAPPLP